MDSLVIEVCPKIIENQLEIAVMVEQAHTYKLISKDFYLLALGTLI